MAAVFVVSGAAAVLAGCGSPAATERPVAAPTSTAAPIQSATATFTPTPVPTADEGLEFLPVDSLGSSGKQEPISAVDSDSTQKGGSATDGPVQGEIYTWQDGDRTMTVRLQTDLVVEKDTGGMPGDVVAA